MDFVYAIICSVGRAQVLHETVLSVLRQEKSFDKVLLCVVKEDDVLQETRMLTGVEVLISPRKGLCAQRNYAIESLSDRIDRSLVCFFDDDVELERRFFSDVSRFMRSAEDVVAFSCKVIADGGIDRRSARVEMEMSRADESDSFRNTGKHWILYGCNMVIRGETLRKCPFNEELPLYSYGEDYDISIRLARFGKVGRFEGARLIHLKHEGGRVSEFRRGYSMVANNLHFLKSGVCHVPVSLGYVRLVVVIVLKEGACDLLQGVRQWVCGGGSLGMDFLGRLKGRAYAVRDILMGRCHPGRILEFS